ncbi:MAG: YaeQ family protein [Gammaproteobacteria bacterium]
MALKATVYKAHLNVADTDRGYYADHSLTLALHPSETEERLMVRMLAFALYASERLEFCRGISNDDEPDLWEKDLTGDILRWIELGQPDETRIRKACNRSRDVVVITFGARASEPWWDKIAPALARHDNLTVLRIPAEASAALAELAERGMDWQVTIQDGVAYVSTAAGNVEVAPVTWMAPPASR